ncbi:hypothetical protein F2Q68_00030186 [Brassica cretica]|uniref:Uncharacterized protein n=1 Tax=Brassica cretica TaxID=69181 RepID=A0A8S9G8G9_BRACR|nr:hypothetical protein F2Q68_00030186 [Brassica cretica]
MTFLQHDVFRETLYQRNIISKILEAGQELSTTGIKHDGIEARRENPKLDETLISNIRMGVEKYSGLIADQKITGRTEIKRINREARGGSLHGFRTWCQPSNKLSVYRSLRCRLAWKLYMQPDMSWSKFCDSDRIVPSPSRSASRPWCWVGRSVMFLFDCWLAVGSIISSPGCWTVNQSCSCLIVGRLIDHISRTVRGCYRGGCLVRTVRLLVSIASGGSSRPNPNPKRKRRDKYSELGCGMDWTYGEEQDFVGKGLHQSIWGKEYREGFEKPECYSRATIRDDPAIIQLKTIVEALRRTLKKPWWTE